MGGIVQDTQGMHPPRTSLLGVMHSSRNKPTKRCILPGMRPPRNGSSKEHILQGTHPIKFVNTSKKSPLLKRKIWRKMKRRRKRKMSESEFRHKKKWSSVRATEC
jgi:hypothetical protein